MLIPLGTDRALKRKPVITQTLIGLNVVIYVLILAAFRYGGLDLEEIISWGAFDTRRPERVWTLVTSMFLHDPGGIGHILFNMVFLWSFGCTVEDRLGRLGFLSFYLAGGVAAALSGPVSLCAVPFRAPRALWTQMGLERCQQSCNIAPSVHTLHCRGWFQ